MSSLNVGNAVVSVDACIRITIKDNDEFIPVDVSVDSLSRQGIYRAETSLPIIWHSDYIRVPKKATKWFEFKLDNIQDSISSVNLSIGGTCSKDRKGKIKCNIKK